MPCCPFCGDDYLDQDGEVIPHLLRAARLKRLAVLKQTETVLFTKQGGVAPNWLRDAEISRLSQPLTEDDYLCLCDCHVVGSTVLH